MTKRETGKCSFCIDVETQRIAESDFVQLLYPRRPIFEHHLLLVPKEHTQRYDQISKEALFDLQGLLSDLVEKVADSDLGAWLGYNIFSNNGDSAVGQHVPHYHAHIFLRYRDEKQSPYVLLNENRRIEMGEEEWVLNRDAYRELFR